MQVKLNTFISKKFTFWSFVSMFVLVFLHGYNLNHRYLQPWTMVEEPLTFNTYFQYFLCNGIFKFRIPMLFAISGYLFAVQDYKPYKQQIGKRFKTLLIPYFIWSIFALLLTYLFEMFAVTKGLVESSHLMQIDEKRMFLHEYKWYEWLEKALANPVAYQLWFLRVLFIYNLAYPVIKWLVTHKVAKYIFFPLVTLFWLSHGHLYFIEGEGLLFFALGVWMQKTNFNIELPNKWLKPLPWAIILVAAVAVKTQMAYLGYEKIKPWMGLVVLLYKIAIPSGLICMWFGCDTIVMWCMNKKWFVWLTSFSFMIYALHVPLVTYTIDGMFKLLNYMPHYRFIAFFVLPISIIALAVSIGYILKNTLPKVYGILTGGRGL